MNLGVVANEIRRDIHDDGIRGRDSEIAEDHGRDPLVDQDARVLEIVRELNDITSPVR